MTSGGLLGVWGKWVKHAKYIYNIQDFNPEQVLAVGYTKSKVLKTNDTWYGMTYHEDVAAVKDSFKKMLEDGVYKADLFADL